MLEMRGYGAPVVPRISRGILARRPERRIPMRMLLAGLAGGDRRRPLAKKNWPFQVSPDFIAP